MADIHEVPVALLNFPEGSPLVDFVFLKFGVQGIALRAQADFELREPLCDFGGDQGDVVESQDFGGVPILAVVSRIISTIRKK